MTARPPGWAERSTRPPTSIHAVPWNALPRDLWLACCRCGAWLVTEVAGFGGGVVFCQECADAIDLGRGA